MLVLSLQQNPGATWQGEASVPAGPWPSVAGGTGLPNSRRVGAVLECQSLATLALSSSRRDRFAHVCSSKHPPAPGDSHVGHEPLTWAKSCAVISVPLLRSLPHFRPSYE